MDLLHVARRPLHMKPAANTDGQRASANTARRQHGCAEAPQRRASIRAIYFASIWMTFYATVTLLHCKGSYTPSVTVTVEQQ